MPGGLTVEKPSALPFFSPPSRIAELPEEKRKAADLRRAPSPENVAKSVGLFSAGTKREAVSPTYRQHPVLCAEKNIK